jgi:hypothetical protein
MRTLALLVLVPLALGGLTVSHAAVMVTRFEGDFTRQAGTPVSRRGPLPARRGQPPSPSRASIARPRAPRCG